MVIRTFTDGNTSTRGNKRSAVMTKGGTQIVSPCSTCGQEDYATFSDGKWYYDLHISLKNSRIVVWISSNLEAKQVLDMMTALLHSCSPSGTAITGPSNTSPIPQLKP